MQQQVGTLHIGLLQHQDESEEVVDAGCMDGRHKQGWHNVQQQRFAAVIFEDLHRKPKGLNGETVWWKIDRKR